MSYNRRHEEIGYWAYDYYPLMRGQFEAHLHHTPPSHYLDYRVDGKALVILLPGIFEKWGFLKKLADTISLLGHPVYPMKSLGYNTSQVPYSAELVKQAIVDNNSTRPSCGCFSTTSY